MSSSTKFEFWSAYRFCFDPRYLTVDPCGEQPPNRYKISVPNKQWEAITRSFNQAEATSWKHDNEYDVRLDVRQKQTRADSIMNMKPKDVVDAVLAGKFKKDSFETQHYKARKEQIEAYKDIALWRARFGRTDDATGATLPWLRDPEVQKGIQLACETNDEEFFKRLGRILSQKREAPKRLPIETVLKKNWINENLPLAIFSDEALADLCYGISLSFGLQEVFDKDAITHRRAEYGLQNLGGTLYAKKTLGLKRAIGPIIREAMPTGRVGVMLHAEKRVEFLELIAKSKRASALRLRANLRNSRTSKPQRPQAL